MQDITFDQLLEAARTLQPEQRQALAEMLHLASVPPAQTDLFADPEALETLTGAGAFSVDTALVDLHPPPHQITNAELVAAAQCISCEWEEEDAL